MRVASTLLAFSAPFPAFACGGACPTGLAAYAPMLLMGGGFDVVAVGKLVLGRFS